MITIKYNTRTTTVIKFYKNIFCTMNTKALKCQFIFNVQCFQKKNRKYFKNNGKTQKIKCLERMHINKV